LGVVSYSPYLDLGKDVLELRECCGVGTFLVGTDTDFSIHPTSALASG
jgi:hypothetical protein